MTLTQYSVTLENYISRVEQNPKLQKYFKRDIGLGDLLEALKKAVNNIPRDHTPEGTRVPTDPSMGAALSPPPGPVIREMSYYTEEMWKSQQHDDVQQDQGLATSSRKQVALGRSYNNPNQEHVNVW